jgi:16S rRNA (uracil1498-N3)-methyltransferase
VDFDAALDEIKRLDIAIAAWEKETEKKMKQALNGFAGQTAGLMAGPEGGFSDEEAARFKDNGVHTVTLGKRILRTETAGFACSILFFNETGEF